jgi:hypothetical protein
VKPGFALALILFGLALGTFSSLVFVWIWIAGPPTQPGATILGAVVAAAFLSLFQYLNRRAPRSHVRAARHTTRTALILVGVLLAIGYAGSSTVRHLKELPHGGWDAWAVWNAHARFLYRGDGDLWMNTFAPSVAENEYPLLLPGLVSGAWTIAGTESPVIPAVFAILFAGLSIGIVCTAISALAKDERGWLAALLLLATPSFLLIAALQTADVPIALYTLTTVVLLQFADAWPDVKRPMLVLAGLSAGFAAWTKNEGLLFVIAVFSSHFASFAFLRAWRALRDNLLFIGLGLAPMLLLVLSFKTLLAPPSSIVSPVVLNETVGQVASFERYQQIASEFFGQAKGFGGTWNTVGIHPAILLAFFLLLYAWPLKQITPTSLSLLLLVVFMLGGYFMVYVFSPYESVEGYVRYTLDRLYLQLWPACLFILATVQLSPNFAGFSTKRLSHE